MKQPKVARPAHNGVATKNSETGSRIITPVHSVPMIVTPPTTLEYSSCSVLPQMEKTLYQNSASKRKNSMIKASHDWAEDVMPRRDSGIKDWRIEGANPLVVDGSHTWRNRVNGDCHSDLGTCAHWKLIRQNPHSILVET